MKKSIKINFVDFWPGFDKSNNYFYNLLLKEFNIEISNSPDYLFYSLFGNEHLKYNCTKISYHGENVAPTFINSSNVGDGCHYSFSFDYMDDDRNYRLPHYLLYDGYYDLSKSKSIEPWMANRKFCNFVASNPNSEKRNSFVQKLSKYKKVDCGGRWMNNIGFIVGDKKEFQSQYKFSIAFENGAYRPEHNGYTTEKLPQCMQANTIGIYWGNPTIELEFNTESFINYHDFKTENDIIDYIIYLDQNNTEYLNKLNKPWFKNNEIPENNKIENISNFLYKIFENK